MGGLAEYEVRPTRILVHDPVAAGAFGGLAEVEEQSIEQRLLFRERPDVDLYARQHKEMVRLIAEKVAVTFLSELEIDESLEAARVNPNQVFTRDSLITIPWVPKGYLPARMKRTLRRSETATMEAAVGKLGLEPILRLPENCFLEGGDFIPFSRAGRRTLLIGFGRRSAFESLEFLSQQLIPEYADEVVGIAMSPCRMNLDGGLVPVAENLVVADLDSLLGCVVLDRSGTREIAVPDWLQQQGIEVVQTSREESVFRQACNCLCLGERTVVYYDLCPRVAEDLRRYGMTVLTFPGSELVKGRGGPRCMTRPIYL